MAYSHRSEDGILAWFDDRNQEQRDAHEGDALRRWAELVLPELPEGPLELVALSTEGCALAAVVAALRIDGPTSWRRLNLDRVREVARERALAVVEPVALGEGLRATLAELLPTATVYAGFASRDAVGAA